MTQIEEQLKDVFGSYLESYNERDDRVSFYLNTTCITGGELRFLADVFDDVIIHRDEDSFRIVCKMEY